MTSRRLFLAFAVFAKFLRGAERATLSPALYPFVDLATELPLTRLTDPGYSSVLPPANANPVPRRGATLLYSCDASGSWQAYRMDLKSGEARQFTDAESLVPSSLAMLANEQGFCYWDESRFMTAPFNTGVARQIYKASASFEPGTGVHVNSDGAYIALIEKRASLYRLRLISMASRTASTLAEANVEIRDPAIRPRRASVLYRREDGLYLANFDGRQNYRLRVANGEVLQAMWSPDGRSVLYLNAPGPGKLNAIREFVPDTNEDRLVAETTQFAAFTRNSDASVFAGASGAKASPYLLLLVRAVKRELTLCEHRASDPSMAAPVFAPNSQQLFFTSDLHGKPAIYRMDIAKLVAETAEARE